VPRNERNNGRSDLDVLLGREGLCREYHMPHQVPERSCFYCGHTMALHPGVNNPELEVCVLCEIRATLGRLQ
jgi:hypothetical protein